MKSQSLKPRIIVLENSVPTRTHEVEPGQELIVGRQATCQILIAQPSVSRKHARIFCDATGVNVQDLGTANGTYVNDQRIQGTSMLRPGDIVRPGQAREANPVVLRFEDPSAVLLDALADDEKSSSGILPKPPRPEAEAGAGDGVPPEGAVAVEPPPLPAPPQGFLKVILQPVVWIPVAGVVAAGVILGLWLVLKAGPSQKPWQSVRVEPIVVRPGYKMTLRGPEVVPFDGLRVFLQDCEAKVESAAPGEISLTVPEVIAGELGVQTILLRVKLKEIVLFQQPVQYEVVPFVRNVQPQQAAVGGIVSLDGTGFTTDPKSVRVKIGQMDAPVTNSTLTQIQFRIPVITRNAVIDAPLEVRIGDWVSPPLTLKVGPRDAPCHKLTLTASYVADRVWEIRHDFGAMLFVEGLAPSGAVSEDPSSYPRTVQQSIQVLEDAFLKAQSDPTIRFEIRDFGGPPALVATGSSMRGFREVIRWTSAALAIAKTRTQFSGDAVMMPYWNVMVLNEFVNLFGKGQAPAILASGSVTRTVLQRLYDRNLEVGGSGCPGDDDVQTLSLVERDQIQQGLWDIPAQFGVAAGRWEGQLENIFGASSDNVVRRLRLDLRQRGTSLSGSATVEEHRGQGIRWSPPEISGVNGRLVLGTDVRIELTLPPVRPFNVVRLTGSLRGDVLQGSFTTSDGRRGSCQLRRVGGD